MSARSQVSVIAAALAAAAPAWTADAWAAPADCLQAQAIYDEEGASVRLTFDPSVRADDGVHHRFEIVFPENEVTMQGVVLPAEGLQRPWGIVMHDCPEGDATGEEIAACMVWEGVIYAIDGEGNVTYLPGAGEESMAAASILLPDFGNAVTLSAARGENLLSAAPSDVFGAEGCRP